MQTQINWIKYEGKTKGLEAGEYFVYGAYIGNGALIKEMRQARLWKDKTWINLDSFIIEYIAPLREIERGIEEGVNKQK